jgi:EpsD family peptidyl-prolyl cis-trans isomerase
MKRTDAPLPRAVCLIMSLGLMGALLIGCSKKPEATQNTNQVTGQVIAHVGKQDITAQELANEFRWAQVPPDKREDEAVIKRVLGELVLRKYLAQRAVDAGLDRDPTVLLDLLRNRDGVLAQAFIARDVGTKVSAIGKSQIDALIASQPWRFGDRQILTVEQITTPPTPEAQAAVEATKDAKSLDEIDQKLNELKILHSRSMGLISSSQLPEQLYKTIQDKKDTDQFYIRTPNGGIFFRVKEMDPRPLTGEEAAKFAREQLVNDIVREETNTKAIAAAADAEVKYEGPYARIMGKEEAPKPTEAPTPAEAPKPADSK